MDYLKKSLNKNFSNSLNFIHSYPWKPMPMADLIIAAGRKALAHIRKHGLSPNDISAIFGASGAAKWLAIAGIDHKIFARFMSQRTDKTPVDLFGTSVGAFKLSGAARNDCGTIINIMADAYIAQSYAGEFDFNSIDKQTDIVFEKFLEKVIFFFLELIFYYPLRQTVLV